MFGDLHPHAGKFNNVVMVGWRTGGSVMEESINIGAAIARAARKLVEMSAHWGEFDNIEFTRFAVQTLLAVEPRAAGLPDDEMINVVEWVVWWATRIHARRVPLRLVD